MSNYKAALKQRIKDWASGLKNEEQEDLELREKLGVGEEIPEEEFNSLMDQVTVGGPIRRLGKVGYKYVKMGVDDLLKENPDWLYHTTSKNNLDKIAKEGLLPKFGNASTNVHGQKLNGTEKPVSFMSDYVHPHFSIWADRAGNHPGSQHPLTTYRDKAGIALLKRQPDIFQATEVPIHLDKQRSMIKRSTQPLPQAAHHFDDLDQIPPNVEERDFFTFNKKKPEYLVDGGDAIELMEKQDRWGESTLRDYLARNQKWVFQQHQDK
jgi:hypothetical protein